MDLFLMEEAVRRGREDAKGHLCKETIRPADAPKKVGWSSDWPKCDRPAEFAVHTLADSWREHDPEGHDSYYCEEHAPRCKIGGCPEVGILSVEISTDGSFYNLHGTFCPAHFKEFFEARPEFTLGSPGGGVWGGPGDETNRYCRLIANPPEEGFRGHWVPGYRSKLKELVL